VKLEHYLLNVRRQWRGIFCTPNKALFQRGPMTDSDRSDRSGVGPTRALRRTADHGHPPLPRYRIPMHGVSSFPTSF